LESPERPVQKKWATGFWSNPKVEADEAQNRIRHHELTLNNHRHGDAHANRNHVLQNFAPSNLNRDDTGSPKDAEFRRTPPRRVSSQCLKAGGPEILRIGRPDPGREPGPSYETASRRSIEALAAGGRTPEQITRAIGSALAGSGLKIADGNMTQYLLFLGEGSCSIRRSGEHALGKN